MGGVTATPSYASGFFGNLPTDSGVGTSVGIKAVSFTLPTGNDYSLDSVILNLRDYDLGDIPILTIRNDIGGTDPGSTVLASFTNPTPQGAGNFDYTFTPSSAFTFQAGTKYWLTVTGDPFSSWGFNWRGSLPSVTPTGIPTFGAYRFRNTSPSFSNSSAFNSFQINATEQIQSVPEPLTILGTATAVGFGAIFKRRLAKKQA